MKRMETILNHFHPPPIFTIYLPKNQLNIIFPSPSWSFKWTFHKKFPFPVPSFHCILEFAVLAALLDLYKSENAWIRGCIQTFPDWPSGARNANDTALGHYVQLYHYFVSQSSEFCHHNPLCCFSTSVYCCKLVFRYRLSPETFGYTLVHSCLCRSYIVLRRSE
jgi:hypothetical protein